MNGQAIPLHLFSKPETAVLLLRKADPLQSGPRKLTSLLAGYAAGVVAYGIAWAVCLLFERNDSAVEKLAPAHESGVLLAGPAGDPCA